MVATFRTSKMSEGSEKEEGSSGESGLRLDLSDQHGVARRSWHSSGEWKQSHRAATMDKTSL